MAILEAITEHGDGATASEVAEAAGLSLSTTTRLLHQLTARHVLERSDGDRRYTLGPRLFALVRRGGAQFDFSAVARPIMQRLRDAIGETVSLHVRRGDQRVCLAAVPSRQVVHRAVPVGTTMPLHRNATGEVLLAGAPPAERVQYVAALRLPPHEQANLEQRLDQIRLEGWAQVVDGWVPGLCGISAAVGNPSEPIAALSVSGPASRFTESVARDHLDTLIEAAKELSEWSGAPIR